MAVGQLDGAPHWRPWAWLVCAATIAHNTEELLTMAAYDDRLARMFELVGGSPATAIAGFRIVNVCISALAVALTVVGVARRLPALPGLVAATMVLNVGIPHVPAALASGGYAPGVVTAVLLILPVCGGFLWYAHRTGLLPTRVLLRLFAVGLALILVALPLALLAVGSLAAG